MTTQEREYMGRPTEAKNTTFVQPTELLYLGIDDLKKKVAALEEWQKKSEREAESINRMMKSERSFREAAEIEAAANLKALQKCKTVLQKQGEALICENYGPSRYRLLIVARALIGTATAPDENWRLNAVNWFDDFEREIRGLACEPMADTAGNVKDQAENQETTGKGGRSRSQSKSARK